jgi:transcriptional regulator with XRE-family HTH domain
MTTCNTSPITPPLAQRLKAARIALPAKQDEIATFWQLANRQVVSDWERGKSEIPAEMIPKIEQLERWAAAGGGLDAARAELARLKDAELAAQLERVQHKATTWQALGSRPVPLIESAQLELGAPCTPSAPPVESASQPPADPYKVTIDWEGFVVEVEGKRGISLRELVKAGLYAQYRDAELALRAAGVEGSCVERKNPDGGRPGQDVLISSLRDAQLFCMRARSDAGERIAALILDHHEEFQRLLSGDAGAQARLDEAQATAQRIEAQASADPLLGSLLALAQVRQVQLDQSARLDALERQAALRAQHDRQMVAALEDLPAPTVEARPLVLRKQIVALVQDVGFKAGGGEAYHDRWAHLYAQFEHRYSIDLKTRAKNKGMKPLDYAEQYGHLDDLYALAVSIWRPAAGDARA